MPARVVGRKASFSSKAHMRLRSLDTCSQGIPDGYEATVSSQNFKDIHAHQAWLERGYKRVV